MGGRPRGLRAAALVDGNVDDDRAGLHRLDRLRGDELRRLGARDQHRADDEIGAPAQGLDRVAGGEHRAHAAAKVLSMRRSASGLRSTTVTSAPMPAAIRAALTPTDAAAEHHHVGGRHARHAAEQHAAAADLLFEAVRARLGRHAAGDLRHRHQQRQGALRARHRLIGDGDARPRPSGPRPARGSGARCR